ncbi:hypothetical protein [Chryseobacterium binzhouense]|uniref:hypothetical protein n=1 Tax=Chryseobacterium binzhouense TaxID=2593646 RepID=UPI00289A126E|nr:hypothetical protein [Chryseobacterium binzhouense]
MPTTQKPYYPKLSELITLDNLPTSLDFLKNISQSIFSKLYYKNYQASVSSLGESAFYSLSIVPKDQIAFDLVYGLKFVLNRDYEDSSISSFPITVQYNWPIIAYFSQFNLDSFSFSSQEIFNLIVISLNLAEVTVINEVINVFINTTDDPVNKFVDDINSDLAGSLTTPIPYPTSDDRIGELVVSINNSYGDGAALASFTTYILDNFSISNTKNNLKLFFKAILPTDIDEYIHEIITPYAAVTLETSASIEFPRNILRPWIQNASGELSPDLDEAHKTYFDFAKAVFYADTASGIGYNIDIAGTLRPDYSEIGNTGLLIQIDRLKLDLSRTKNIPEADDYGYSPDFMGVYAKAISVTFPAKWFYDETNPPTTSATTLRLGGYDLLVGTGGVSGTIMLESIPVTAPGTTFEYYNDKFDFNYPILVYDKNPAGEIIRVVINDYAQLKDVIGDILFSSNAPLPFHFPLSLTPIGQVDSLFFDKAENYQNYLASLRSDSDMLWKRLGGENGFQIGFKSFDITLNQNSIVSSNIAGGLRIAKFKYPDDMPVVGGQPVQIDVLGHIEGNGDFLLTASAVPPFPIQFGEVFKLHLNSVELGREGDKFFIGASADVEFLGYLGTLLKGQTLSISTLRIYSDGHIDFRINGGNLILPQPIKIPIGPVEVSVTAVHFGSHEREKDGKLRKYNYFGFDGGVSIGVAGIDARGDGIKYYYTIDDDKAAGKDHHAYLHIQTIHVDMVIPANSSDPSVAIKGWLSIPEPGEFQEFQGGVSLKVKNPRIAGGVDMRLAPKYPAFLIDANIELPNPIALGPVSIYGFRGLLGYRYVAEKEAIGMTSQNTWYQYYTAPVRGVNVRKFNRPDKTAHYSFPFSLGVGAILGDTMAAGTIISANAMLLLSLPSMVMIDARMKLLSSRVKFTDDPPFFAFFIFGDNSLEFGFGADYKFPENSGDVIKLYAEIQAGFFFNNPSAWYINFGTQQNPITAKLLKDLFTLKAFLMISGKGIQAGARGEFRFDRSFGPVKVFVLAYLELGGKISFQKPQMGAYFEAGLAIDVDVKIIRIFIAVTILLAVESPKPFLIYGKFTIEFKLKLFIIKIKFKVQLELKWEFNKEVDRSPVNPFTEIQAQTDSLVKGISMLTNETFDLIQLNAASVDSLDPNTIHNVVPLDTYIDIKTTKGLLPSATTSAVIGGYTNPAGNYNDLIPPEKIMKGLELRQVKHQYSLESIEIKAHNGSGWVNYNPFKAMEPTNPLLNNLKSGQWQKKDNQYNAVRLLGMTPFSYTEQGNPGWFTPEQYGIMASTLFCQGQNIEHFVSDFLDKPLNTLYYASTSNFFQSKGASYQISGDVQYSIDANGNTVMTAEYAKVSNEPNIHGFLKSLEFKNHSTLTIMLPAPSAEIELKLSTYSTGLTINYYAPVIDDQQSLVQYSMVAVKYISKNDLIDPVFLDVPPHQGITKIIITPDVTDQLQINLVLQEMAMLMDQGYQNALQQGGAIGSIQPSDPQRYEDLEAQLSELQSIGCEGYTVDKYEIICSIYPDMVKYYNNNFIEPFYPGDLNPEEAQNNYCNFIKENLESGIYQSIIDTLSSTGIPEPLYAVNIEQYGALFENLVWTIENNPDDCIEIINSFELLKIKFQQIIQMLHAMNLCEDETLCNLSTYLSYQQFYDENSNTSPLVTELNDFIGNSSWYQYLTEILNRQLSTIALIHELGYDAYIFYQNEYNVACQEIISIINDLGNCESEKKCFTMFHEVKWMSVEDYQYNINIPSQAAISADTQAAIDAITKSVQPIWRPDTVYYIKFTLKDTVDNLVSQPYSYAYGFKTAGPLGFFHLDRDATYGDLPIENSSNILEDTIGVIRDANGNVIDDTLTPHPDLYPHTSLRAYIDYQRSYPNADGNTVNAKPLFYDDVTTKISLYFTSSYVSKLLSGWDEYTDIGLDALGGTMKIIIKDPVEGIEIINPPRLDATEQTIETSPVDIPQTIEEWAQDPNPAIPTVLDQYFNMLNSGDNCTGIVTLVKPKSLFRTIIPKRLKPQKLYTAQVLNFYWGKEQVDMTNITEDIKLNYAKEVHKFVFQTSRYKDFNEQIGSYKISYVNENNEPQFKESLYDIKMTVAQDKIDAALDVIKDLANPLSEAISLQYQHPFDRVFQGLFGISPLEDSKTTEINRIVNVNGNDQKVVALLIRNPEPFNHPKIPLEKIKRNILSNGTIEAGMIEAVNISKISVTVNTGFLWIYSKDYSQAIVMNNAKWIQESFLSFQFLYKIWDGLNYNISSTAFIQNVKIN